MPLANYGAANPAATDPWPIENTLAPLAATSPALARTMLNSYQLQRQADTNNYGEQLDQQHQFARDQQKQQLYEALLKAAPEYAGKPGGAALFAALPGSAGLGATPGALGNFAQAGAVNDAATNFQHAAAGLASASEGGVQYDPRYIPGLPNANILSIGPNARVQAAEIQERGRMGAASISAANKQPHTVNIQSKYQDDQGNPISIPMPWQPNMTDDQVAAMKDRADQIAQILKGKSTGVAGITKPTGSTTTAPVDRSTALTDTDITKQTSTSNPFYGLPVPPAMGGTTPAQTDTPAPAQTPLPVNPRTPAATPAAKVAPPAQEQVQPASDQPKVITDPKMQQQAKSAFATITDPAARQDILANITGSGVMPLIMLSNGNLGFMGKRGFHAIPMKGQ